MKVTKVISLINFIKILKYLTYLCNLAGGVENIIYISNPFLLVWVHDLNVFEA